MIAKPLDTTQISGKRQRWSLSQNEPIPTSSHQLPPNIIGKYPVNVFEKVINYKLFQEGYTTKAYTDLGEVQKRVPLMLSYASL